MSKIVPLDRGIITDVILDLGFGVIVVDVPDGAVEYLDDEDLLASRFVAAPLLDGRWVVIEAGSLSDDGTYQVHHFANVTDEEAAHSLLAIWAEKSVLARRDYFNAQEVVLIAFGKSREDYLDALAAVTL